MNEFLKIYTYDPQFEKTLEGFLRTNYPEADIKKSKRKDTLVVKKSAKEKLTIKFEGDPQQKTTIVSFRYMKWVVRGIHYGLMGIWPTPVALSESNGFEEDMSAQLGRYMGARYGVRAEFLKPTGIKTDTFFVAGLLLLGCLFFLFSKCFDSANMYDIWWFSGWYKNNIWVALIYTITAWIVFFVMWNKKRGLPWLAYCLLPICCMAGWLLLSLSWNVNRLAGPGYLTIILVSTSIIILIVMGIVLYMFSRRQKQPSHKVSILYNP